MSRKSTLLGLASLMVMPVISTSEKTDEDIQVKKDAVRVNALEGENEEDPKLDPPEVDNLNNEFADIDDINADQILILKSGDLNFSKDRIVIDANSEQLLKDIKDYVYKNNYSIAIIGHTENMRSGYGERLSLKRAENVKEELISLGLDPGSIVQVVGKGALDPLVSNETKAGRAENRRIEIRLYKNDLA